MSLFEPTAALGADDIRAGYNETGVALATRIFLKRVAGGDVDSVAVCGAGERSLGVSMQAIADEDRGNVQLEGQAIVTAAAAIVRGAEVAADAAGKAVLATTGDIVLGTTRSAAAGADEDIEIELVRQGGNVAP